MQVIPPGLDFSSLKVDLPEDPAIKEMEAMKPAFNARTTLSPSGSSANLQAMEQTGRGMLVLLDPLFCGLQTTSEDCSRAVYLRIVCEDSSREYRMSTT